MSMPSYIETYRSGKLSRRIEQANAILEECSLCPRQCGVNRWEGDEGFCRTGKEAMVSSCSPHFGEEDPLVGTHGSGTIFMSGCNILCIFCQNWEISHRQDGNAVNEEGLAGMMMHLQKQGCHNINFVTPSHMVPQILRALPRAIEAGLNVPLVYNTGGYDAVETLQLLEGIFDIYMPDFKFWDPDISRKYLKAHDYPEKAREALREMHRQVGDLVLDEQEVAVRGILLRHLVMPQGIAGTREIMRFVARHVSPDTYVNIMDQYRPCGNAYQYSELNRRITGEEYEDALQAARQEGINRLDNRQKRMIFRWLR